MPFRRARKAKAGRSKRGRSPSLAKLKKTAWGFLSEAIRRSAADQAGGVDCYTCDGWSHWKSMQAGHAIGGRNGAVLLDEEIIRPQCVRCNIMLRGNYPVFIHRLIQEKASGCQRIILRGKDCTNDQAIHTDGLAEAHSWWESKLQYSRQVKKWDRAELQGKIESYKARLQALGS